jgi:serine/threonine protein kinase
MIAGTETAQRTPPNGSEGANRVWLDAVSSGICTPAVFYRAMHDQHQGNPDESWEVLSLLDQYYRRGKIKADLFQTLKAHLESEALGGRGTAPARSPKPAATPPTITRATPAPPATPPPVAPSAVATMPFAAVPAAPEHDETPQKAASPRARVVRELSTGTLLRGRYRLGPVVGQGGTGTVFEATDEYRFDLPTTTQRVAIKVLRPAISQREDLLYEVQRGFQHLQLLSHPNIVRVHEFDRDGDVAFFSMEFLSGAPLSRVLSSRNAAGLPRPYALTVMRDVGAALAHAHSIGLVHGDLTPRNVFITNNGELRVLDFAASHKLLREKWAADIELAQRAPVAAPGYASCQLLEGHNPDTRDDIFALACISYMLLSGSHPFPNRTAVEAYAQHFKPRRPPQLTGHQWKVLREGLRWERDRRPADVEDWLKRFGLLGAAPRLPSSTVLASTPPPRRHTALVASAVAATLVLLAAGAYWAVTHTDILSRLEPDTASTAPPPETLTSQEPPAVREEPIPAPTLAAPSKPAPQPRAALAPPAPAIAVSPSVKPFSAATPAPAVRPPPAAAPANDAAARSAAAGPVRVEMAADTVDVASGDTTALVTVRRKGNLHGAASFSWWTESGTAKPGTDFAPVTPRVGEIADGSASVSLSVPLSGAPRSQPKSFYVVIDHNDSGGAQLGAKTLTMVTLPAS